MVTKKKPSVARRVSALLGQVAELHTLEGSPYRPGIAREPEAARQIRALQRKLTPELEQELAKKAKQLRLEISQKYDELSGLKLRREHMQVLCKHPGTYDFCQLCFGGRAPK